MRLFDNIRQNFLINFNFMGDFSNNFNSLNFSIVESHLTNENYVQKPNFKRD